MKSNEPTQVELTYHAYIRYIERVEMITWDELEQRCQQCFAENVYIVKKKRFVFLMDTWWTFRKNRERMVLTTCYGTSDFDLPQGLIWAEVHHDQIKLSQADRGSAT